jgi:hypothetical protein
MLNEYAKDANGKWIKKGAIGDGSGVSALTGEIHQANGTVLNQSGQKMIDAHAKTVNGMVKDGGQWKSKADLISNGQMQSAAGGSTGSSFGKNVGKTMNANLGTNTQGAANLVKNNISNGERLTNSFQAGRQAGMNSVGLKQGALNTWNKMGKMGKAGVIGAGVLGAGLLAKGLMGGGSKEAAFSEDTGAALQEAAIYGTVGAGTLGAIALAKRGKLGFTKAQRAGNKEAYQKVVKKVKSVWAEQGGKAREMTQETKTVKTPGKPAQTTTKTSVRKVTINKSDWPKVRAHMEANGMDLHDPAAKLKAAKAVGVTPSVK